MNDLLLQQQQQLTSAIVDNNYKRANNRTYTFSVNKFAGFNSSLPQTELGSPYGSIAVNVIPNITHLEKAPGIEAIGYFRDFNPTYPQFENILCGYAEVRRRNDIYFTIIWDNDLKEGNFYTYESSQGRFPDLTKFWQRANPLLDSKDPSKGEYKFKSKNIDFTQYKNLLFFCSGEERFIDPDSKKECGLLCYNMETGIWSGVNTGKAAKLDISSDSKSIDVSSQDAYLNKLEDFNPSLVETYKERLIISGAESNPYQVKSSEYLNPKNFVDNALGPLPVTLTLEDDLKTSTFFIGERVTSLTVFGDNMYIGSPDRFFLYSLVPSGANISLDRISPDYSSITGPVNNKSCKVFRGGFYFVSNNQIIPELNVRELEYKTALSGGIYTVAKAPEKLTYFIDETLRFSNVENATVGIYKDSVLMSYNDKSQDDKNNKTLLFRKIGDNYCYSILDYIHANYFNEVGNKGLIFSSADDGNVYLIRDDNNFIDKHNLTTVNPDGSFEKNPVDFHSVFQTGITGIAQNDSTLSAKRLDYLIIQGGFSGDSLMGVEIFRTGRPCQDETCCGGEIYSFKVSISDGCLQGCSDEESSCNESSSFDLDLDYYKNIKYFKKIFRLPIGKEFSLGYNELYIKLSIANSAAFYISNIQGIYSVGQSLDPDLMNCAIDKNQETVVYFNGIEEITVDDCITCK